MSEKSFYRVLSEIHYKSVNLKTWLDYQSPNVTKLFKSVFKVKVQTLLSLDQQNNKGISKYQLLGIAAGLVLACRAPHDYQDIKLSLNNGDSLAYNFNSYEDRNLLPIIGIY